MSGRGRPVLPQRSRQLCQFPSGLKDELPDRDHLCKADLVDGVCRAVVIFMDTREEEHDGDAVAGKIVVVAAFVEIVRIARVIICVIKIQVDRPIVDRLEQE